MVHGDLRYIKEHVDSTYVQDHDQSTLILVEHLFTFTYRRSCSGQISRYTNANLMISCNSTHISDALSETEIGLIILSWWKNTPSMDWVIVNDFQVNVLVWWAANIYYEMKNHYIITSKRQFFLQFSLD